MKRFFVCVLCALAVIGASAFSGCSVGYSVERQGFSLGGDKVNYYLILKMPQGEYNFKYTVYYEDIEGNRIAEFNRQDTLTVMENYRAELRYSFFKKDGVIVNKVSFEDMRISPVANNDDAYVYAAVTGAISAVILSGLITLFVLDKKGKLKR